MPRGAGRIACVALLLARAAVSHSQPDTAIAGTRARGGGRGLRNLARDAASAASGRRRLHDERQQLLAEVGITSAAQDEMTEHEVSEVIAKIKIAKLRMEADERLRGGSLIFDKRTQKIMVRIKRGTKHAKSLRQHAMQDEAKNRSTSRTGPKRSGSKQRLTINDSPETLAFSRICTRGFKCKGLRDGQSDVQSEP